MRSLLFFLIFSLSAMIVSGQKLPPKSSPPPAPTSPPPQPPPPKPVANNSGTAGAGFRLLKIPVTEQLYLGMERIEYDSVSPLTKINIRTEKSDYRLLPSPLFTGKRLSQLKLTLDSSSFTSVPDDIIAYYEAKLGVPDKKQEKDTLRQLVASADSVLNRKYPAKEINLTWHFKHHDVILTGLLVNVEEGVWKGAFSIRYAGNMLFVDMLKEMEYREGY